MIFYYKHIAHWMYIHELGLPDPLYKIGAHTVCAVIEQETENSSAHLWIAGDIYNSHVRELLLSHDFEFASALQVWLKTFASIDDARRLRDSLCVALNFVEDEDEYIGVFNAYKHLLLYDLQAHKKDQETIDYQLGKLNSLWRISVINSEVQN